MPTAIVYLRKNGSNKVSEFQKVEETKTCSPTEKKFVMESCQVKNQNKFDSCRSNGNSAKQFC